MLCVNSMGQGMHRIDGSGATAENLFTEGNPLSATPATQVTADWLNATQEEISGAIEGAGIALDKEDNGQLLAAIIALIEANSPSPFETGDVRPTFRTTAIPGWIMADDGTLGPSGSGATTRANDDTEALFKLLWNGVADTWASVSGGRGASADEDWGAGKTIAVPKVLGRALAVAGGGSGLTSRALGEVLGEEAHTLTTDEMPLHGHPYRVNAGSSAGTESSGGLALDANNPTARAAYTGIPTNNNAQQIGGEGGDEAHNTMQPTFFVNVMIKL